MLGPTYDWCSGVNGSRLSYTPLDHYTKTRPAFDPTYDRRLYTQIKLHTIPQESSFQPQHTQLFYTNCENNKLWTLFTVKYDQQYRPFPAVEFRGKRKPLTHVNTKNSFT